MNKRTDIFQIILLLLLTLLYFSPYFLKAKAAYIPVHDNLNQLNMQGIFAGKMQAKFFPSQVSEEFTLPGTHPVFHLAHLKLDKLFFSFDYFWGFVFNEIFYRLWAFFGCFLLLADYLIKDQLSRLQIGWLSLAFITLPFWPQGNLSIAGIPLLLWAFFNLSAGRKSLFSILIFLFFPFYSNIFLSGIFLIFIFLIALLMLAAKRKLNIYLINAFLFFLLGYVISHLPVFLNHFLYKIPTNRSDQILEGFDLWGSVKVMICHFFRSYPLSPSLHAAVIFPSSLLITIFLIFRREKARLKTILPFLYLLLLFPVFYGLFYWQPVLDLYNLSGLGFRLERIYVLNPVVWFLLWSLLLAWLAQIFSGRIFRIVFVILIAAQLAINFQAYTWQAYFGKPSFQEFFSEKQFAAIRRSLPKEDFRIGCVGFYPAVANFNGFKTVDSFSAYYPLEYKDKFRKIIQAKLQQNEELQEYFENKGSALFLFDDEIGLDYADQEKLKQNVRSIICELDLNELRNLNVKYLFSAMPISNAKEIGLKEIDYERRAEDYYDLHVYEIMDVEE